MNEFRPSADRPLHDEELGAITAWEILNPGGFAPLFQVGEFFDRLFRAGPLRNDAAAQRAIGAVNLGWQDRVSELCWRWVLLGLLVPEGAGFRPTSRGAELLSGEWNISKMVFLPDGISSHLHLLDPPVDEQVLFYTTEAHFCFLAGLYQATAVMLGVATEALVDSLADALTPHEGVFELAHGQPGWNARRRLEWVAESFRDHPGPIRAYIRQRGGEGRWLSDLPGLLTAEANAIRLTRNSAGHPSGDRVDRRIAMTLLVLFPKLAEAATITAAELAA